MKAFQLPEKKEFMNLLLRSSVFDQFLLAHVSIYTAVNYEIDGRLNADFYTEEELAQKQLTCLTHMPYRELRPICFALIKGHHTPSYFKFVLMLSPVNMENTIRAAGTSVTFDDISAIYLHIVYQNDQIVLTTGISYRNFILDKSFEKEWDRYAQSFLKKNGIIFSEI